MPSSSRACSRPVTCAVATAPTPRAATRSAPCDRSRTPSPTTPPVGRLLRQTGRHPWRAAHIHAIVTADGHRRVVTHVFDSSSRYLDSDTVFGVKQSLVRDVVPGDDGVLVCEHDITLAAVAR